MSAIKKDGGPAFPRPCATSESFECPAQPGISLRDWFASQARADLSYETAEGLMGGVVKLDLSGEPGATIRNAIAQAEWWAAAIAKHRFIQADAMLEARKAAAS